MKKIANRHQLGKQYPVGTKNKPRDTSSSQKYLKNISIFKIQNIEKLNQHQTLQIGSQILERMVQKKTLDFIRQKNISDKSSRKSGLIDFTFNPLAQVSNSHTSKDDREKQRKISLIDAVSQLKTQKYRNYQAIEKLRSRTQGRIDNALNYQYNIQKGADFSLNYNGKKERQPVLQEQATYQQNVLEKSFQELDNIIMINEKKIQMINEQKLNIFQVIFKKRSEIFFQINQYLFRYKFNFQSVLYGLGKQPKINFYKEISIYNRYFITNQPSKVPQIYKLTSVNILIALSNLNSNDLLMIATGKLSPRILAQYLSSKVQLQNDQEYQRYLLKQIQLINQQNNPFNTNVINSQVNVSSSLLQAEKQWRIPIYQQLSYQQQLQSLLKNQKLKSELHIKDRKLSVQMKTEKEKFLIDLLDKNSPNKCNDVADRIKLSKINKDSFQNSRNIAINEIFKRYKELLHHNLSQNGKKLISISSRRPNKSESNSPMKKLRKTSVDIQKKRKKSVTPSKSITYND